MLPQSRYFPQFVFLAIAFLVVACTQENYEPGDGEYSYLRGDFAEVSTNAGGNVVSFITDNDRRLTLKKPVMAGDLKSDTIYRALVYFTDPLKADAEVKNIRLINVCRPWASSNQQMMKTDPVGWESVWISHNRKYLNLALKLMVGVGGDDNAEARQVVSVRRDAVTDRHVYYSLYHDQNGVPEYYTYKTFVSIPLGDDVQSGDAFTISVNTYDGIQRKTVFVP